MIDIIIIGAGPAGMTAGMYAARAGLRAVIAEQAFPGGQVATANRIENYPGFPAGIGGAELSQKMEEQARAVGAEFVAGEILSMELEGDVKEIRTAEGTLRARAVILCMGAVPRLLGVPGEARLRGAGVSYCATCDGFFFRGKRVAVVGGGDTAAEDAAYLSALCSEVLLVHRRERMRAQESLAARALALPNVRPLWNARVTEVLGEDNVEGIRLDVRGEDTQEGVSGVFVAVGTTPNTQMLKGSLALDEGGYVRAGEDTRTSLPLVYAAGDIRTKQLRQIVTAAADGAVAVYSALADLAR